jgi:hypothetical protein
LPGPLAADYSRAQRLEPSSPNARRATVDYNFEFSGQPHLVSQASLSEANAE